LILHDDYSVLPDYHWFAHTFDFRLREFYSCGVCMNANNFNRYLCRDELAMNISRILFDMAKGQPFSYPSSIQHYFRDIDKNHWAYDGIHYFSWVYEHFGETFDGGKRVTRNDVVAITNTIIEYLIANYPSIFVLAPSIDIDSETQCPKNMVRIAANTNSFCIDEYEFPNFNGASPSSGMTGRVAALVCDMEGKRLCTASEWGMACRGPENAAYVYGDHYVGGFCNDFLMSRGAGEAKASGATLGCVNGYGLYDMSGNLAEWTAPESQPDGTTVQRVRGGSFAQDDDETALSCGASKTPVIVANINSFSPEFETYGTRCCTD
jgi:hypothetical protein